MIKINTCFKNTQY